MLKVHLCLNFVNKYIHLQANIGEIFDVGYISLKKAQIM